MVVGCGVIGMATALRLREAGWNVEVWTREDPRATTSAAAGAIWYPYLAEPRDAVLRWSAVTYSVLAEFAEREDAGVSMKEVVEVFAHEAPELWWAEALPDADRPVACAAPEGFAAAVRARVPVVDVPRHIDWLLRALQRAAVPVVRREVAALEDALEARHLVVNCAGLGARELCGDRELRPVRGQVLCVSGVQSAADAWIDDTAAQPRYVIPHAGGAVVGGTAQDDDERREPDERDSAEILAGLCSAFPQLAGAQVEGVRVGLRPYRSTVRLERALCPGGRVLVHNYGHGGSGYTVAWGCAEDVVSLARG